MADIDALAARFADRTLEPEALTHRTHVHLAWLYLQTGPFEIAAGRLASDLRRYVAALGKAEKYHTTITWAHLALVSERRADGEDFAHFEAQNPDLFEGKSALAALYDAATLASPLARRAFVLPRCSCCRAREAMRSR